MHKNERSEFCRLFIFFTINRKVVVYILEITWGDFCSASNKPEKQKMTIEAINTCAQTQIWGSACKRRIDRQNCPAMAKGGTCQGIETGSEDPLSVAVQRLEAYRSTGVGLGHLSNTRAVHASPVPFR